jgi:predicted enzyme related to lactoylglutathione lyase
MTTDGKFVWFDYVAKDINKAQGFYGELFGWKTESVPMPDGPYTMISAGGRTIGGYTKTPPGAPEHGHWMPHLRTANAAATSKTIEERGGKLLMAAFKVGEFGTMAVARDPLGGLFALWQPAKPEEAPAPTVGQFCWNELGTPDPEASAKFYSAVGGFTANATDMQGMGKYHVLESGGQQRAGIAKLRMEGQPVAWTPYVAVANTDQTIERAKKLGATIVVPPIDIPVGRFAVLVDPMGGATGVLQAAQK